MSGSGPALAHRSVASIRSSQTPGGQGQPSSPSATPHTPPRTISSSYGSPSTIRADDDIIIVELGSRFIRAGFAGDSLPKATLQCGEEEQRRVGDFRAWSAGGERRKVGLAWAKEHEIWRYDQREVDLGLVNDKLDRLFREAFTKYLLIDSRPRRMVFVIDSDMPQPLLSTVLDTAFDRFQTPMVSLLSSASMSTVAAGVRSALVIDLGWAETVVTSVYEYREVKSTRTVRAGRYLLDELYNKVLRRLITGGEESEDTPKKDEKDDKDIEHVLSFEEAEDIMCRLMWCRASAFRSSERDSAQLETVEEQDETEAEAAAAAVAQAQAQASPPQKGTTRVPLTSTTPPKTVEVPFEKLADVCDDTFFDPSSPPASFDDHELPIHMLVYQHLLQLPIDARATCMSRILFTGGCSNVLGLKERIIDELTAIVERRGWEPVSGKAVDNLNRTSILNRRSTGGGASPSDAASPPSEEDTQSETSSRAGTATATPDQDPIEAKVARHRWRPPVVQGQIRALHSLGAWSGASLMCQVKTSALATIDRELWLQQGLNGASRPNEVDLKAQQRQSMGAGGLIRSSGGHHTNWTLGTWGAV